MVILWLKATKMFGTEFHIIKDIKPVRFTSDNQKQVC